MRGGIHHITKMRDVRFNPTGLAWSGMCADASSIIASRLAGADLSRWGARSPQQLLEHARALAATRGASRDLQQGITVAQRAAIFDDLGIATRHTDDIAEALAAMRAGQPVVLNGYARQPGLWHARHGADLVIPDGHHAVAASFDARLGSFLVHDPNSRIGAIPVSSSELRRFANTPAVEFQTGATILTPLRPTRAGS